MVNDIGPANGISGGPYDNYTSIKMNATTTSTGIRVTIPARAALFMVVDKK